MAAQIEEYQFQAETRQLLNLMIHSLYTNKEIFLRELISNASDAIDRVRFESLSRPELISDQKFEIRLDVDRDKRTLSVSDNGIGMSREEVIANIGTIARSGTRELREKMDEAQSAEVLTEFIGQFGVGFYSAFMVADRISLVTRRAGEQQSTSWESTGDNKYTLSDAQKEGQGTSITLHLRPVDPDSGIEDYTDEWVISRIVRRYSDFVSYPIVLKAKRDETESDPLAVPKENDSFPVVYEDKVLNSMKPLWTRPQSEVSDGEYEEFYKHISHSWEKPFETIALKAEGVLEYESLLFIPSKAPHDLYYHAAESGLRLYAKRVMIMEKCEALLPNYLRFINGVVDSADLPLNISRQMLQQDRHIAQIRKWLTKKVLDRLLAIYEKEQERYLEFWNQFGRTIKEGVASDYENKDKIVTLLLFQSSHDAEKLTTLKDYVERMKEDQQEIFYLTGESRRMVDSSPHLEVFKQNGYEVLYLTEPVDELLVQSLSEFEGKKIKSAGKGKAQLGTPEEREKAEKEIKQEEEKSSELLEFIQKHLDEHVKQARLSTRLTVSPVCLVGNEIDYSPQLERLLQKGKGGGPKQRRIMELNPRHEIYTRMQERFQRDKSDPVLGNYAELLLGYALLAEGSELPDPAQFNRLVAGLMAQALCP